MVHFSYFCGPSLISAPSGPISLPKSCTVSEDILQSCRSRLLAVPSELIAREYEIEDI